MNNLIHKYKVIIAVSLILQQQNVRQISGSVPMVSALARDGGVIQRVIARISRMKWDATVRTWLYLPLFTQYTIPCMCCIKTCHYFLLLMYAWYMSEETACLSGVTLTFIDLKYKQKLVA